VVFEFPTSLSAAARDRFDRRERVAAAASVGALIAPRSIAVVGASRSRGTIGGEVFHNLLATGFTGPVFPVNPAARVVQSVLSYPSIRDVPGPVDLAVIVVPAASVLDAARECAAKGVHALVVISAGFAETGADGARLQHELHRDLSRRRDAARRTELHGDHEYRRRGTDERHLRTELPTGRPRRVHVAERRPRPRDHRGGRAPRDRPLVASCRSATRRTCRATTWCSTGRATRRPM